ncbi:hypothetical protein [Parasphaerochaeta coccoides]|nr:hypothetical protein [Parasphaerochaeta coccoides]
MNKRSIPASIGQASLPHDCAMVNAMVGAMVNAIAVNPGCQLPPILVF